jgi:NADH:ubiquinone oxidoreductase subunit B-like Fe-S oxidoreductase
LYFAVELLTESVPIDVDIMSSQCKEVVETVTEKIDNVYKRIKKNEESPNTEYLFNNLETENNMDKTIKRMDMLNNMDFVPRNNPPTI